MTNSTFTSEEEIYNEFTENFCYVASLQGRVSYLLMSVHAVNPLIWHKFSDYNLSGPLFINMLYGMAIFIYSRPSLMSISTFNRFAFSILGSMMFNYSSMQVFEFLVEKLPDRPILRTFLGFLCGRLMMVHLLAYLYHNDTRNVNMRGHGRNPAFEQMYA